MIIGSDNWTLFPRWYQSERILAENHILVYPRPGYPVSFDSLSENVKVASSPTFEISSTFIRRAMEEGKDVRLLPPFGGLRGTFIQVSSLSNATVWHGIILWNRYPHPTCMNW